jgi:hypothetical protein
VNDTYWLIPERTTVVLTLKSLLPVTVAEDVFAVLYLKVFHVREPLALNDEIVIGTFPYHQVQFDLIGLFSCERPVNR